MATEEIRYPSYVEAVLLHIELMRLLGEGRWGVRSRFSLSQTSSAQNRQLNTKAQICYDRLRRSAME